MKIKDFISYLCRHYNLPISEATPIVYVLLESSILKEEDFVVSFMDTKVRPMLPAGELDEIVRQLIVANGESSFPTPEPSATHMVKDVRLVATAPLGLVASPISSIEKMRDVFVEIIEKAEEILYISSPYIEQPGLNLILSSFEKAARKGTQVRLLTRIDDPSNPDMRLITAIWTLHHLFRDRMEVRSFARTVENKKRRLSLGGTHAKLLIADKTLAYVGSGEIRDHSLNRNFEVGFVVGNLELVIPLTQLFNAVWRVSSKVTIEYCQSFVK